MGNGMPRRIGQRRRNRQAEIRGKQALEVEASRLKGAPEDPVESLRRGRICRRHQLRSLQGARFKMRSDKVSRWDLAASSQQEGAPASAPWPSSNPDSKLEADFSRCQPSWFFASPAFQRLIGTNSETWNVNFRRLTTPTAMVSTSHRALCACHRIRRSQAGRMLHPLAYGAIKQPLAVVTRTCPRLLSRAVPRKTR